MKEAIGTSLVFNLMMIFIGVLIVILVSSISYSKAFKIRNRILDRIQEYEGYNIESGVVAAIENDLKDIGYRITDQVECKDRNGVKSLTDSYAGGYDYCVYEYSDNTNKGKYYGVTVFINFDIPLVRNYIKIPVYGETRIIFDKGLVEG